MGLLLREPGPRARFLKFEQVSSGENCSGDNLRQTASKNCFQDAEQLFSEWERLSCDVVAAARRSRGCSDVRKGGKARRLLSDMEFS